MIVTIIEVILIVVTYIISESYWTAGIAAAITIVGYILSGDGSNPLEKACSVFCLACVSGLVYVFGANAKNIASYVSEDMFGEMKSWLIELGDILSTGATPPFDITGNGVTDWTIFIFGFAIIELVFQIVRLGIKKHK